MAGYNLVLKVKRIEDSLSKLGMRWGHHKSGWGDSENTDMVSVYPRDEELPIYTRDACLFTGTIDQLDMWIRGVQWARDYDMLNKVSDEKKRARKEQDQRNINMMRRIKSQKVEGIS